jgi:hypothetical protein
MLRNTILICTLALAAVPALAGTPHLDQREAHQQQRVANGINSGELTPRETVRLERGEARLQHNEARAKADGVVTAKERVALNAEADHMSKRIYRQKHDAQTFH